MSFGDLEVSVLVYTIKNKNPAPPNMEAEQTQRSIHCSIFLYQAPGFVQY